MSDSTVYWAAVERAMYGDGPILRATVLAIDALGNGTMPAARATVEVGRAIAGAVRVPEAREFSRFVATQGVMAALQREARALQDA